MRKNRGLRRLGGSTRRGAQKKRKPGFNTVKKKRGKGRQGEKIQKQPKNRDQKTHKKQKKKKKRPTKKKNKKTKKKRKKKKNNPETRTSPKHLRTERLGGGSSQ